MSSTLGAESIVGNSALLVIDVQQAIDEPDWAREGPRNNPEAEANIARLLDAWRRARRPIFHIRHDSTSSHSTYRPGQPGNDFKHVVRPLAGEAVIPKRVHSAFIGTDLEQRLRAAGVVQLVITGVITNNSVEATVRMAADLGFEVYLVEDGIFTFGKRDYHGTPRTAAEVHAMSLANLKDEYCIVVTTMQLLAMLANDGDGPARSGGG
ncbi:MAG TPA: cysteine hydrolase family protein [Alphaproteobacteria bacterium]|nr:cysteine hydrolase family protein [Alphaproteobacteria bacterium]